jgi:hypothetical protein
MNKPENFEQVIGQNDARLRRPDRRPGYKSSLSPSWEAVKPSDS